MKFRLANKGLDYAVRGSLGSCLLAGALGGVLGAAGCGSGVSAQPPGMTPPAADMGTTTTPIPYNPPYPPLAPQVQRGSGGPLTAPRVIPLFFSGDKLQNQLISFVQAYITRSISWQVLKEYGIGYGTVDTAKVLNAGIERVGK